MIKVRRTVERKTRQVTLLFKPSVYEAFQKIAYVQQISPNSLIGNLIEDYVSEHVKLVENYDELVKSGEE